MYSIHFQSNMKSIILVLALCVCAFAYELEEYTWEGFKKIHKRTYVGVEEEMREKIFDDNLQYITDFNAQGYSFQLGVNQFADLTNLEFRRMMLGYEAGLKKESNDKQHVCSMHVDDLPDSVDWRDKKVVTPIKNQGQCGSCWAFSATGALEGQYALKNNGTLLSFSEQQLVDCSTAEGNHGCQGGLMDNAYTYLEKDLEEQNKDYEYNGENGKCKYDASLGVMNDKSYHDIKSGSVPDVQEAVATVGPISVAMDASHISFQFYFFGVYDPSWCSATKLDHGVLIVGYGKKDGKDAWIVKNSWGTGWGEKGYFYIARDKNKCGLCTSASYPIL